MTLENPIRAIREISHDITCRRRVRLANGRELSARSRSRPSTSTGRCASPKRKGLAPLEEQALEMWEHVPHPARERPAQARPRVRLGHQAPPHRGVPRPSTTSRSRHPKVALLDLQYHDVNRERGALLPAAATAASSSASCTDDEIDDAVDDAAADHAGPAARRVHPAGQGAQARLHGRLGAPEAQRPGAAHGAVQGPVQVTRRAGREAHRVALTAPAPATLRILVIESDSPPDADVPDPEESAPRSNVKSILEWVGVIVGALLVALLIKTFLFQAFYIPSRLDGADARASVTGCSSTSSATSSTTSTAATSSCSNGRRTRPTRRDQGPDQAGHRPARRDDRDAERPGVHRRASARRAYLPSGHGDRQPRRPTKVPQATRSS